MSINETIKIARINNQPTSFNLNATDEELNELKNYLEILELTQLQCNVVALKNVNNISIIGNLKADIIQECSVSLELIKTTLELKINKKYHVIKKPKNKEIVINLNDEDEEELTGEIIYLKAIIKEELLLNINPYIKIINLANKI